MRNFEPTRQAALERLAAVQPGEYARTRNSLDGAVTGLSPYLTHGLISLPEAFTAVHARYPLHAEHKLVFEWGWRAYYRHVWAHRGAGIHQSFHTGPLPDAAYSTVMPPDVLQAGTGIAVIDCAVRQLYATGYLHNHARMWLASYLVHLCKVHWHTGAQWMLAHLLDGDVASNHLSWQWVAGTVSSKPYLFNADNVAKFAPAQWHSPGTVLDTSYEALQHIAYSISKSPDTLSARLAVLQHCLRRTFASRMIWKWNYHASTPQPSSTDEPLAQPATQCSPSGTAWTAPDSAIAAGRDVWLLHPWSIGAWPDSLPEQALCLGVGFIESHADMAWSQRRWDFVTRGLQARSRHLWWGTTQQVAQALQTARSVHGVLEPHVNPALNVLQAALQTAGPHPELRPQTPAFLFEPVDVYCRSFSVWWRQVKINAFDKNT